MLMPFFIVACSACDDTHTHTRQLDLRTSRKIRWHNSLSWIPWFIGVAWLLLILLHLFSSFFYFLLVLRKITCTALCIISYSPDGFRCRVISFVDIVCWIIQNIDINMNIPKFTICSAFWCRFAIKIIFKNLYRCMSIYLHTFIYDSTFEFLFIWGLDEKTWKSALRK